MSLRAGLLYFEGNRLCIPRSQQGTVMAGVHSPPHAAHFEMGKTYRKVASLYYWPKMWRSVASFVRVCDRCQRSKGPTVARPRLLQPLPIPSRPWESTCIDRLTDLPPSGDEGFDAILVVLCWLIKAVVLIPTHSTAGAEKTMRIYRQHISCKKGFQRHIVCDRDPRFLAHFWQTLHASSGSEVDFATASHHDTAGAAERMNRTLEEALRYLVDTKHSRWSEFLCDMEFAYNSSVHEGTGFAPLALDGGKSPLIPPALNLPVSVEPSFDAKEFLEEHSQMIAAVRDSLRSAQQVMTRNANRRRRPAENIRVGDYCTWWPRPVGKGEEYARKLDLVWFGPFEVETVLPQDNLEVVLPAGSRKHPIIHTSLCKPYRQPSGETRPPSVRMSAWAEEQYEVEKILAVQGRGKAKQYKLCKPFMQGRCEEGDQCTFAHGVHDQRSCPDLFRTKLCKKWLRGLCTGPNCSFAHGAHELRETSEFHKTRLCKHWAVGNCVAGEACRHAHGEEDLRTLTGAALHRLSDRAKFREAMHRPDSDPLATGGTGGGGVGVAARASPLPSPFRDPPSNRPQPHHQQQQQQQYPLGPTRGDPEDIPRPIQPHMMPPVGMGMSAGGSGAVSSGYPGRPPAVGPPTRHIDVPPPSPSERPTRMMPGPSSSSSYSQPPLPAYPAYGIGGDVGGGGGSYAPPPPYFDQDPGQQGGYEGGVSGVSSEFGHQPSSSSAQPLQKYGNPPPPQPPQYQDYSRPSSSSARPMPPATDPYAVRGGDNRALPAVDFGAPPHPHVPDEETVVGLGPDSVDMWVGAGGLGVPLPAAPVSVSVGASSLRSHHPVAPPPPPWFSTGPMGAAAAAAASSAAAPSPWPPVPSPHTAGGGQGPSGVPVGGLSLAVPAMAGWALPPQQPPGDQWAAAAGNGWGGAVQGPPKPDRPTGLQIAQGSSVQNPGASSAETVASRTLQQQQQGGPGGPLHPMSGTASSGTEFDQSVEMAGFDLSTFPVPPVERQSRGEQR
uniref:Integrase catalytic domain-containing protein n=1 Tax=Chromera velia CCMP2878 TaxID=1169474 RepID=A0A0G4FKF9_9ALVE|eukprot:Cvel_404.t1-p1 / transcript=Cvel_404.t1 / gene=Cvel_404 / organism=Chromera_velia_CCMP2878 / gene_product=Transposon Ty3-I Gag-Pol polyprotein, putative / transcript_product=Transposon Ty3-I Gag-Pol polyprotein, putative / location=Cvel_scaffold13:41794-47100(+) / protein_length=1001 / sequence_SO=supercontig / SO=protein_coding / is_pseudo=false